MSDFRDVNSPGCWINYDKELEKERELMRKILEEEKKSKQTKT